MNNRNGAPIARGHILAIAFVIQNCAAGLTFGSYGALIPAVERELGAPRSLTASGLALVLLAMGLLAPAVGGFIARFSLRKVMIFGALLDAGGYLLLSQLQDIRWMLATYALLIGPGTLLYGTLSCAVLVSHWFTTKRGLALGVINMPVLVMLVPAASVAILTRHGLPVVYLCIAGMIVASLPLLLFVQDRPAGEDREVPVPAGAPSARVEVALDPMLTTRELLANRRYLLACLAIGLAVSGGTMFITHMVPMMLDRGVDLARASQLLAVSGGAGIVGSLAFGVLADRLGPRATLAAITTLQSLLWLGLLLPLPVPGLFVLVFLIGCCGGALSGIFGALLGTLFSAQNFGRALGLASSLTVLFTFASAPVAGAIFDLTHAYTVPVLIHVAAYATAATLFLSLMRRSPTNPNGMVTGTKH